jgi:hypothetical protein
MDGRNRFNFDEWKELAKADLEGFERRRRQIIEDFIQGAPPEHQHKLRQTQWKADAIIETSKDSLQACIRLSHLMIEGALKEQGLLEKMMELQKRLLDFIEKSLKAGPRGSPGFG